MLEMIRNSFRRLHDQEGATAVEYGIMVAAIAAVIITVVVFLGGEVESSFQSTCDELAAVDTADAGCDGN